jgi:PDZ domain/Aspartyl protease
VTKARTSCFVLFVLACVSRPAAADAPATAPVKVPFELLRSQHMTVMVKVNGKGPFRLIFDTGAPVVLLTNKLAREAGVIAKSQKNPPFAVFGSMGQFKVKSLELGGLKAENLSAIVMDHPTVAAMSKALGPIEGIVGFSFFARYRMTIDYQAKELTFVPTNFEPPDLLARVTAMLLGPKEPAGKRLVAPAGQWGFRVSKDKSDQDAGVVVEDVYADSPAARAGLRKGDRLLTLDGRWTDSVLDCYTAASHVQPGSTAGVTLLRNGKELELTVRVRAGL